MNYILETHSGLANQQEPDGGTPITVGADGDGTASGSSAGEDAKG